VSTHVLQSMSISRSLQPSQKYITWVSDNKVSWTLNAPGVGPDPTVEISARQVSQEPMVGLARAVGYLVTLMVLP
jgi:hypothetical protein